MKTSTEPQDQKEKRRTFYLWLFLLSVWLLFILVPSLFRGQTGVYIFDSNEYASYYDRGGWIYTHQAPVSEYPQLPTYLFGLNRFLSSFVNPDLQFGAFYALSSLEMIVALFFAIRMLLKLLPQNQRAAAYLMLLPPCLYYVLNRFDILPALLCLIVIRLLQQKRWWWAAVFLALATFTKWYPLLLLPGIFVYASLKEHKLQWKMMAAFLLASLLIILPTYLQGGLDAVLVPYQFHLSRGMEYVALPVLVNNLLVNVFHSEVDSGSFFLFFFVLQVFSTVLSLFLKLDTHEKLMKYSVLVVALFILFSRINSPQWFLWLMPFLILSLRGKLDVVIVILYTTLTYLFCPLVFNVYGNSAPQTQFFALLCYLILVLLAVRAWQVLRFDEGLSFIKLLFNRKQSKG